jgi:hypothetical protein
MFILLSNEINGDAENGIDRKRQRKPGKSQLDNYTGKQPFAYTSDIDSGR